MKRDERLKSLIRERLGAFDVRSQSAPAAHGAAVAVALIDEGHGADLEGLPAPEEWSEGAAILLTRRSLALRSHPGRSL